MTPAEDQLICRYLDGRLREEDKDALQDLLRNSDVARKRLRMLATVTEALSGREAAPKTNRAPRKQVLIPWVLAAAATLVALFGWMDRGPSVTYPDPFLALLVDEAGAQFSRDRAPDDFRFQQGRHTLEQGTIHLRFANGADVVMQAPASFEIRDGFYMRLDYGVVWAMAPPGARGFTVAAPGVDYEDLGTEFAIWVDRNTGASQLQVIEGQVDVKQPDTEKLLSSVTGGQALQFAGGRLEAADTGDLKAYPEPGTLGLLRWEEQRAALTKADPDLIGYYPFSEGAALRNEAANPRAGNGRIHGARWVSGRWPGKQALLFDRDTDFVELEIPGEYDEMTFSAWVKLDRIDHTLTSIFNSNGWDMGDVHWSIHRPGTMGIGAKGSAVKDVNPPLKSVPTDQWVHLAGTLSRTSGRSCVYLNGELAGTRTIDLESVRIRPGVGRIGNWFMGDRKDKAPMRALRGKMDELVIWKRTLTATEIQAIVEGGKPDKLWSVASK